MLSLCGAIVARGRVEVILVIEEEVVLGAFFLIKKMHHLMNKLKSTLITKQSFSLARIAIKMVITQFFALHDGKINLPHNRVVKSHASSDAKILNFAGFILSIFLNC